MKSSIVKLFIPILLLLTGLSSCFVAINENNYRFLTEKTLPHFVPFDIEVVSKNDLDYTNEFKVYEISTPDFKSSFKQSKFTWVHLWLPYCSNEYCQNIGAFQNQESELKDHEVNLMLVSVSYEIDKILECVEHASFTKPIFVLEDQFYGHKIRPAFLKCYEELGLDVSDKKSVIGIDDLLFKDDELIHFGKHLSVEQMDSVMKAN